jgi:ribonuclease P protein component
VVVSAKVSKRAVQRNRLRRLLHAHLLEQPIASPQPIWLLISLKPGSPDLPPEQLLGECRHLLHKAGLTP